MNLDKVTIVLLECATEICHRKCHVRRVSRLGGGVAWFIRAYRNSPFMTYVFSYTDNAL